MPPTTNPIPHLCRFFILRDGRGNVCLSKEIVQLLKANNYPDKTNLLLRVMPDGQIILARSAEALNEANAEITQKEVSV